MNSNQSNPRLIEILAEEFIKKYSIRQSTIESCIEDMSTDESFRLSHHVALSAMQRAVEERDVEWKRRYEAVNIELDYIRNKFSDMKFNECDIKKAMEYSATAQREQIRYGTTNKTHKKYIQSISENKNNESKLYVSKSDESNECLIAEIRHLRTELERVKRYAVHTLDCGIIGGKDDCTCGLKTEGGGDGK
jgi:hypothetical protein